MIHDKISETKCSLFVTSYEQQGGAGDLFYTESERTTRECQRSNLAHILSTASSPGGRFPPSFIHQVIIITGLNKLYDCMFSP